MMPCTKVPPRLRGEKRQGEDRDRVQLPPIGLSAEVDEAISRVAYEVNRRLWLERHCPFAK